MFLSNFKTKINNMDEDKGWIVRCVIENRFPLACGEIFLKWRRHTIFGQSSHEIPANFHCLILIWIENFNLFKYSSIPIFSVPIFSAREENSNSNFSSLSNIFSAPQKSIQQMSKFSGYPMHNSDIFSFFYFQFWYLQSQTTESIGI